MGTSTALTDFNGSAYQFFLNLPFGETMAEQKGSMYYQTPYKFNGKELDEETGLYYYGARYYDPRISIWYSVDPLAEKYPNHSPYVYCSNNPVNMIDPTGKSDYPIYSKNGSYLGDDGRSGGGDLAFTGEKDGKGGFKNLEQITSNHTEFQKSANTVRQESTSNDSREDLWIAHTANNNAKKNNVSLYKKLMTKYSSVDDKSALSIKNNSFDANSARAAIINVLQGGADPTGGALYWDGTDFLAWGLNSPNGTPQNKFEDYSSITIGNSIYSKYLDSQTDKYGGSVKYGKKNYIIPANVFTNGTNWNENGFFYETNQKGPGLISTGSVGNSIFWKTSKQ